MQRKDVRDTSQTGGEKATTVASAVSPAQDRKRCVIAAIFAYGNSSNGSSNTGLGKHRRKTLHTSCFSVRTSSAEYRPVPW